MSIRPVKFSENEYYHIYSRGVNKSSIFNDPKDYERFIKLLFIANSTKNIRLSDISPGKAWALEREELLADIGAYCLMPNHFHILIREKTGNGITKFLQRLKTGYSMYFNKKYDRTGTLFEGKFKAEHVANDDRYLKYLFSYIHLNPVKLIESKWKEVGIKNIDGVDKFLNEYTHSSYFDYLDKERPEGVILEKSAFPEYFINKEEFKNEIYDWLTLKQ